MINPNWTKASRIVVVTDCRLDRVDGVCRLRGNVTAGGRQRVVDGRQVLSVLCLFFSSPPSLLPSSHLVVKSSCRSRL